MHFLSGHPHHMWSCLQLLLQEAFISSNIYIHLCLNSTLSLLLTYLLQTLEVHRRGESETISRRYKKKDLWLCQGLTRQVKWDCSSWLSWRRMLFQANQPMKRALVVIQKAMWHSGCLSAGGDKKRKDYWSGNDSSMIFLYTFLTLFLWWLQSHN